MKKILFFLTTLCALFIFSSCGDQTETFDDTWKNGNEAQFAKIVANSEYKKLESQSNNGFIMYKVLKEGTGKTTPFFTDKVKVLYTGWYKNEWTKEDTYTGEHGNIITNKIVFDSSANRNNIPSIFKVGDPNPSSRLIDGFTTALQHMKEGDKWEIWIPWSLAYGAMGNPNGNIKGYTTLVFEVELVEIL